MIHLGFNKYKRENHDKHHDKSLNQITPWRFLLRYHIQKLYHWPTNYEAKHPNRITHKRYPITPDELTSTSLEARKARGVDSQQKSRNAEALQQALQQLLLHQALLQLLLQQALLQLFNLVLQVGCLPSEQGSHPPNLGERRQI